MIDFILSIDQQILLFINGHNSDFFDAIMIYVSSKLGWLPLYVLLLYIFYTDYKKLIWLPLLVIALSVLLSDQISVHLFKNVFQRLRPCHEEGLIDQLNLIKNCGGKYGFVSSHATNSSSAAALVIMLLRNNRKWIWPVMISYTLVISYSRVYLGVHYPLDVVAGTMLGIIIAIMCYQLFLLIRKHI